MVKYVILFVKHGIEHLCNALCQERTRPFENIQIVGQFIWLIDLRVLVELFDVELLVLVVTNCNDGCSVSMRVTVVWS